MNADLTRLVTDLQFLKGLKENWKKATEPDLWFAVASGVLKQEQGNRWPEIRNIIGPDLEMNPQFTDIRTCGDALQSWEGSLPEISVVYFELKRQYEKEDFEKADEIARDLNTRLSFLPVFSNDESKQNVVNRLRGITNVWNSYTQQNVHGLDAIGVSIKILLDEIQTWVDFHTGVDSHSGMLGKTSTLNSEIGKFKNVVSQYKKEYDKYRSYAWAGKEQDDIRDYFESISGIELLEGADAAVIDEDIWKGVTPQVDDLPVAPSKVQDNFLRAIFGRLGKRKTNPGGNRLLAAIKSSRVVGSTLTKQGRNLNNLMVAISNNLNGFENQPKNISTKKSDDKRKACDDLKKKNQYWLESMTAIQEKNKSCIHARPYPSNQELAARHRGSQFIDLAKKVIEADLRGSDDYQKRQMINAFRDVLIKAWS